MYVEELIGPDTVNTMPEETIHAYQDHGEAALTLRGARRGGKGLRDRAPAASTTSAQDEGVQQFST